MIINAIWFDLKYKNIHECCINVFNILFNAH